MPQTAYRGRRAVAIENESVRVTVLAEGGHIAEILDKRTGVNPLWTPPWPSIEPSAFDAAKHPEYGAGPEAKLLAGIMGHNLCLDVFGGPSPEEAAAGMTVHGEGSIVPYEIEENDGRLHMRARLPVAELSFERSIALSGGAAEIRETVENLSACDRPIAWTQHVTIGPPFLEGGVTQFRASATRSKVYETSFGAHDYLQAGAEFDWPLARQADTAISDLRVMNGASASSGFTTHLMDREQENAYFLAFAPSLNLVFGYVWKRADFPWLGIWEENHSRTNPPWNGQTLARGMEFGVSPIPEPRREMIDRCRLFGAPAYRWLPAKGRLNAHYWAVIQSADRVPAALEWPQ